MTASLKDKSLTTKSLPLLLLRQRLRIHIYIQYFTKRHILYISQSESMLYAHICYRLYLHCHDVLL